MKKWFVTTMITALFIVSACGGGGSNNNGNSAATNAPAATEEASANAGNGGASEEPADEAIVPEEGATLTVWDSKNERGFVEEMAKEFTAQYNIPVKIEEVESPDQVKKLTTDGPAGIGADIVTFPHDNLGQAVAAGLILPNDFFEEETKTANAEAAVNAVTSGGILYGYPRSVETYALFYNKDLVQTPPASFDDIVTFSKTFNDPAKNKYALMWEMGNFYFNYIFFASTGGYVFGENGTNAADIGLNNDGAVEGLKYFQSLKQILPIKSGDASADIIQGKFADKSLAMTITGPWKVGDFKNLGINFGVAPIPTVNGKPAVSFSGVKAWYVNSFTKYPNASRLFANFISSKAGQLKDYSLTGAIPANKEAMEDPTFKADEISSGFAAQFVNSQAMPSIPEMGKVWDPIGAALADIWNENKDPKASLDNAVKQIQDAAKGTTK
ncbi:MULTISPECIES: maltose ABC transporter substrate-binding protein [unclassified Paenibacillus]|uniref:sugar ABC transporter substrate-binding protein n=1 Tax=unclassified Paenibacillus TaxID=185978 RepID=UPI00104448E8|nr:MULTISPECIES: maltose ABC transporter substrate-binding protein [unclassified Paenibacillus]NIK69550.1 arabinogalactan oligomer/maltooligosaccharide transport system substrate-binding protein [Paenibacillus sp. BK720]TCM95727.1 carbohydrate ABC transporter substrate-binding protein (CUT1 family) [Paenibacillus sp. BK033]